MTVSFIMAASRCQALVRTGLDNIHSYKHILSGKRIGIITNHTAYDRHGRYIIDIFKDMENVTVAALFGPEHGIYGVEKDGKKVAGATEPTHKLPIYSLYGETLKPTAQMLQRVDMLVFDIQDIGARFYTYIYTMSLAMEAAAEHGKRFVVLDRPNPINGLQVEGNILKPESASFVGLHPIPVRHGMTVAELATMFNEQAWLAKGAKADLVVVPMKGWRRSDWYDQTGLRFIKPSPNMPDLKTAAIYPGLCLVEGTNISEGRGTPMPFRQFGAPWIDSENLAARLNKLNLPGMRFEPSSFSPAESKYKGRKCHGVKIIITNRDLLSSFYSGILIINEIYRMHPDAFQWRTTHFDRLCGTSAIREAITTQSSLEKLRESWQPDLKSFLRIRDKYLIYRD
ncbi:MAG: hypothetical protein AMJ75_04900 [Phycisphaerae bacterium SM1_79]|nr:MAG: hypothetical protein AMJ75_04900 [Phycisphaerae bacterium SM1_79]